MSKFIEVINANKGAIIKKGLVVVGTLVGLAIVDSLRSKKDEGIVEEEFLFAEDTEEKDEDDSQED